MLLRFIDFIWWMLYNISTCFLNPYNKSRLKKAFQKCEKCYDHPEAVERQWWNSFHCTLHWNFQNKYFIFWISLLIQITRTSDIRHSIKYVWPSSSNTYDDAFSKRNSIVYVIQSHKRILGIFLRCGGYFHTCLHTYPL